MADDGAQQAGLADAVSAQDTGDLADLGLHADAPKSLGGTVEQVDVLNFKHLASSSS
jgi:hypothetical protein